MLCKSDKPSIIIIIISDDWRPGHHDLVSTNNKHKLVEGAEVCWDSVGILEELEILGSCFSLGGTVALIFLRPV